MMAVSGIIFVLYVLLHMYGNLKVLAGQAAFDEYAHHLREFGEPMLPYEGLLWIIRVVLVVALLAHAYAAFALWSRANGARPQRYAVKKAVERARAGEGPYILEVKTYRYRGHSMSDPAKYRTKEEVDEVKKTRDPIDHLKMLLAAAKATEDELKAIDNEVKAIVAEAVQFAQESPEPDPSELYTDVYVEA